MNKLVDIDMTDENTQLELSSKIPENNNYLINKNLVEWFQNIVKENPNKIAVQEVEYIDEPVLQELTYMQLHLKSNRIANRLLDLEIKPNNIVVIHLKSKLELSICIWGIIKSGSAYCIINSESNPEYINKIIDTINPNCIITDKDIDCPSGKVVSFPSLLDCSNESTPGIDYNLDNLLYCTLTSGTSDKPKAVMVKQRGILNTIFWRINNYKYNISNVTFSVLNPAFDAFGADFYASMLSGGTLVCTSIENKGNYYEILKIMQNMSITNITITPTNLYNILQIMKSPLDTPLKFIILGGEALSKQLLNQVFKLFPDIKVYNEYGPTENSITTTCSQLKYIEDYDNIGKPLPNNKLYLIENGKVSNKGELYISGIGLAEGYLNEIDKTKDMFINNPFQKDKKMYRTGDIAYLDNEGNYHFKKRNDRKVKIHGYFIDLERIEKCLLEMDNIHKVKAELQIDKKTQHQLIYIYVSSFNNNQKININDVHSYLKEHLYDYKINYKIIQQDQFAINANGKADGKLSSQTNNSNIDEFLNNCWENLLGIVNINPDTSFFDLGGNSLLVMDLFLMIEEKFPGKIKLPDLFEYYSINKLSEYIKNKI